VVAGKPSREPVAKAEKCRLKKDAGREIPRERMKFLLNVAAVSQLLIETRRERHDHPQGDFGEASRHLIRCPHRV